MEYTSQFLDLDLIHSNSTNLITSKLKAPAVAPDTILRPRLLEKLNCFNTRKLTLICAPAGFGKTILISDWLKKTENPKAWWIIDKNDNDRNQFIAYLIAALQLVDPKIGEVFNVNIIKNMDIFKILTILINDISQIADEGILILDNFHLIDLPEIQQFMISFIDFLPPQFHLVILSRNDQFLSVGRLRIQNQLLEIRAAELRLNSKEIEQLFDNTLSISLSTSDLLELESITSGWAAALQMVVLIFQNQDPKNICFSDINNLHRFVYDFIYEEIWNDLSQELQQFLVACSILENLNPDLCKAVSGNLNSSRILNDLIRCNFFIFPLHLNTQNYWYQIQKLFLGFLKQNMDPCLKLEYHLRAAEWFENNGYYYEALKHAFSSGNFSCLIRLVSHHSISLLEFGKFSDQIEHFTLLTRSELETQPLLCVTYAWVLIRSGKLEKINELLNSAQKSQNPTPNCVSGEELHSQLLFLQAYLAFIFGDYENTTKLCNEAIQYAKIDSIKSLIARLKGLVNLHQGNFNEAESILRKGFHHSSAINDFQNMGLVSQYLAFMNFDLGNFQEAEIALNRLIQIPRPNESDEFESIFISGQAYTRLSLIYSEWNQTEGVRRIVLQGIRLCEQNGNVFDNLLTYLEAAIVFDQVGDIALVKELLEKAYQLSKRISAFHQHIVNLSYVRHYLFIGDTRAALNKWGQISELNPVKKISRYEQLFEGILYSKIMLLKGDYSVADKTLLTMLQISQQTGAKYKEFEILLILTESSKLQGKNDKSHEYLKKALEIGNLHGYIGSFLSNKYIMDGIIEISGSLPDSLNKYIQKIISFKNHDQTPKNKIQEFVKIKDELLEPLSDRELEVLNLINIGLTNQEISEKLSITLGTTKWHTVNIFSKLNVHSRTQAIVKANKLKIFKNLMITS